MDYQEAKQVSLLVDLINSSEILKEEYSEARISEELITNIKQLCFKDSSFRRSFYTLIKKLGEKYNCIYLNNLKNYENLKFSK